MRWLLALAGIALMSAGGYAVAALTATTGTVSVCATSPAQTIAANGVKVGTISPKVACATVTYTVPTETVTTTVSATTNATTTVANEPAPIAGLGYHQVFRDDFSSLDRTVWDDHIWYDDPPNPAWTGFQQADASGILHLRSSRNFVWGPTPCAGDKPLTCNWPVNTISTFTFAKTFQYGYFEARMKWTAAHGSWPAFWLISDGWARTGSCTTPSGELDVFEGQGGEPDVFYGTAHKDSAGVCGGDAQNGNNYQPIGSDLTTAFHTYGMLWTATTVSWYLDGKLLMSAPTYSTDNQPMDLLLQEWIGGWSAGSDPDSSTPDTIENQVDYVDVWQR